MNGRPPACYLWRRGLHKTNNRVMNKQFLSTLLTAHQGRKDCPPAASVASFFDALLGLLFPEHAPSPLMEEAALVRALDDQQASLTRLIRYCPAQSDVTAADAAAGFFGELEELYARLHEDVSAMYAGDPAAKSKSEVIRSYPGFFAIAAYRAAHALLRRNIQQIPRMLTEYAHSKTGIDIHPGAQIGRSFCIDHGTGIVIGETAVIGNRVKLYQGVTLGALSVSKSDASNKRHPTLEDDVVVYAGATILGGETVIGRGSVVGGNVWLTRSVPAGSKIYYQARMHHTDSGDVDMMIFKTGKD